MIALLVLGGALLSFALFDVFDSDDTIFGGDAAEPLSTDHMVVALADATQVAA